MDDYDEALALWMNTPGMGLNNLDDSKEGIQKYLLRNPDTNFVAREDGKLIGVILSGHDGRRGMIYHAAVETSQRKRGIGRRLVDAAIAALRNEGINKASIVVFRENITGNAFWEKLGFAERSDLVYRNKVITNKDMKQIPAAAFMFHPPVDYNDRKQ